VSPETRVVYIGHAGAVIEGDSGRVVTDPILRGNIGPLVRWGPRIREEWVEDSDAILISHLHHDHLDQPSLRKFPRDTRVIVPLGGEGLLRRIGFERVVAVRVGDRIDVADMEVEVVPAAHDGHRAPFGPRAASVGYVIRTGHTIYFAGDTELFDEMDSLVDDLDLALLPVWGWGPRLGAGHMDPVAAAAAAARLSPRVAVPIHWGSLSMPGARAFNSRFLTEPPHTFATLVERDAPHVAVSVLAPGEGLGLGPGATVQRLEENPIIARSNAVVAWRRNRARRRA
jgi:L-ascorbate metabolism protein UlaG (beta-lactamase superfamily)